MNGRLVPAALAAATLLAEGALAAHEIPPPLPENRASTSDPRRDLSCVVTPGKRAVSVRERSDEPMCGAPFGPGDYVDVRANVTRAPATNGASQNVVLLRRLLVLRGEEDTSSTGAATRDGSAGDDVQLTLSVGREDVQYLALADREGGLSVALHDADDGAADERPVFLDAGHAHARQDRPR